MMQEAFPQAGGGGEKQRKQRCIPKRVFSVRSYGKLKSVPRFELYAAWYW